MKKLLKVFVSVLFIFGAVFALAACDSGTTRITAICPLSGEVLELPFKPIKAHTFGSGCTFSSKLSLVEIKDAVDKMDVSAQLRIRLGDSFNSSSGHTVKTKIFETDRLLITFTETDSGLMHYFLVLRTNTDTATATFTYSFETPQIDGFIFPRHLYNDLKLSEPYFKIGEAYKVNTTVADFTTFYAQTNYFNVVTSEKNIIVSAKDADLFATRKGFGSAQLANFGTYHSLKPFVIDFETKEDGLYATYRLANISLS